MRSDRVWQKAIVQIGPGGSTGVMMASRARINVPREQIADFCRRHHIRRLAFFGSVLRDDFTSESDVDVLVEFEAGKTPGFAFFRIQDELSQILARRVDLKTPNELSKYFRDEVLAEAEELYVQAG
jgi:predicted nucleotidyltransferase